MCGLHNQHPSPRIAQSSSFIQCNNIRGQKVTLNTAHLSNAVYYQCNWINCCHDTHTMRAMDKACQQSWVTIHQKPFTDNYSSRQWDSDDGCEVMLKYMQRNVTFQLYICFTQNWQMIKIANRVLDARNSCLFYSFITVVVNFVKSIFRQSIINIYYKLYFMFPQITDMPSYINTNHRPLLGRCAIGTTAKSVLVITCRHVAAEVARVWSVTD